VGNANCWTEADGLDSANRTVLYASAYHNTTVVVTVAGKTIASQAFAYSGIAQLSGGGALLAIAAQAFGHCDNLGDFTFPDSVTIASSAFYYCSNLEHVKLGAALEGIGEYAFESCAALTRIEFDGNLKELHVNALDNVKLDEFLIFANDENVSTSQVAQRPSYKRFVVAAGSAQYSAEETLLYNKDQTALLASPNTKKVVEVPPSVTELGSYAFRGSRIAKISGGENLLTIGINAFADCQ
jgi:hypothetical protein